MIWETNLKEDANAFCAAAEALVQGINDANKMGQAFVCFMLLICFILLMGLEKGEYWVHICLLYI